MKVLTVGVYDYFHLGHLRLFKQAKNFGDYLIVAVQDSDFIKRYKPNADVFYTTEQRLELISSLSIVDEVIVYQDVQSIVKSVDFDVFAVGEDQNHAGFQEAISYCIAHGKKVEHLHRTKGVSSTEIKLKKK